MEPVHMFTNSDHNNSLCLDFPSSECLASTRDRIRTNVTICGLQEIIVGAVAYSPEVPFPTYVLQMPCNACTLRFVALTSATLLLGGEDLVRDERLLLLAASQDPPLSSHTSSGPDMGIAAPRCAWTLCSSLPT
eukprot:1207060-Rhodomonas_salina.2